MAFIISPEVEEATMAHAHGQDHRTSSRGLIGLKLDISPDIIPRDTSFGTKIFTLLPADIRTVREAKTYIANFVLKTPAPFHFFAGDYRIRDEEPVAILSLISEPSCRLVPVPMPRSALSSTPKSKSNDVSQCPAKRVTFFECDLTTSPVQRVNEDATDGEMRGSLSSNSFQPIAQTLQFMSDNSSQVVGSDDTRDENSSPERKKRRRRRHRTKKPRTAGEEVDANGLPISISSATVKSELASTSLQQKALQNQDPVNGTPPCNGSSSEINKSNSLEALNEETESEDEISHGHGSIIRLKEFDFITPTFATRKRTDDSKHNVFHSRKRKKLSDSAISLEASGIASSSSSSPCTSGSSSFVKTRQDTPIVPRVIRNPRVFEAARKIIDVFTDGDSNKDDDENLQVKSGTNQAIAFMKAISPPTDVLLASELELMDPITSPNEVFVGDKISFKVLQLDEKYNPSISSYKEAVIVEKTGTHQFTIKYTKNDPIVRTGKLELHPQEDGNEGCEVEILQFADFIEPKFIKRSVSLLHSDLLSLSTASTSDAAGSPPSVFN